MRPEIFVLALLSSAGVAQAGSIETIRTGLDPARSVEKIDCAACVRIEHKKTAEAAIELAPGTQKIEIREVDGVKKIFRTEAWLGGSPAVYVSKAMPDATSTVAEGQPVLSEDVATAVATAERPVLSPEADMIDEKATTAAVSTEIGAETKVEPKTASFDPAKLELRVN